MQTYLVQINVLPSGWTSFWIYVSDPISGEALRLPNLFLPKQVLAIVSMMMTFIMAFNIAIFEDIDFSLSDSIFGLMKDGYIVLLSAYGRIMGTVFLVLYCSFYPWILVTVIGINFLGNYLYAKLRYAYYNARYQYLLKING